MPHEAFSIDSFQDRLLFSDDFLGAVLRDLWAMGSTGGGTTAVVDAQDGGIVRLTTGATDGNNTFFWWGNIRSLLVSKKITLETRTKISSASNIKIEQSLYNGNSDFITIFFDTDLAHTNWMIETRDGGANTVADSGIAVDTDYHVFRIECFPTGEVHFYIDGVETSNSPITTNIPPDYLQPLMRISTREDAVKLMDIDYIVCRQEI